MKLKLFIFRLEKVDMSSSPYLKEQIECAADNDNLRKCTEKVKLLQD